MMNATTTIATIMNTAWLIMTMMTAAMTTAIAGTKTMTNTTKTTAKMMHTTTATAIPLHLLPRPTIQPQTTTWHNNGTSCKTALGKPDNYIATSPITHNISPTKEIAQHNDSDDANRLPPGQCTMLTTVTPHPVPLMSRLFFMMNMFGVSQI